MVRKGLQGHLRPHCPVSKVHCYLHLQEGTCWADPCLLWGYLGGPPRVTR